MAKSPKTKAPPISGKFLTKPITMNSLFWSLILSFNFKLSFLKIFSLTIIVLSMSFIFFNIFLGSVNTFPNRG